MRFGPATKLLGLALGAMFLQQTFASISKSLPYVVAPAIVADLAIDPAWLGVYAGINALAALVVQLGCGNLIVRYGAMRMSQLSLVLLAIGLFTASLGPMAFFAFSAIVGGGGVALSTPASSHLLGRYSPPRYAPLVFSIKQTAVPAGLLIAGLLGPAMTEAWSWRVSLQLSALASLLYAFLLQPVRAEFDSDRIPTREIHFSDFASTLTVVTRDRDLRNLAFACFAFNGLQAVFTTYFVTYLVWLGYGLAVAGFFFSLSIMVAVPGRLFWGWLSSGWVAPGRLMAWLAFGMAACSVVMGLYQGHWPVALLAVVAVGISATALSWHGVLLAETARLAPEGMRGAATGGVLSFGQVGAFLLPVTYAVCLSLTDRHSVGFILCGLPALYVGLSLLRRQR